MNLTSNEITAIAKFIDPIFTQYASTYSFEKYPPEDYERYKSVFSRKTHPVIHKLPRQFEFTGVAHALNKGGDVPHTQPECFGPWFPIALSAQKAPQFGNQSDDGVGRGNRPGWWVLVQDEGRPPLIGLKQQVRR